MYIVIWVIVILILFFISIVNFYYQKLKYKYSSKEEIERLSLFEAPSTWLFCLILTALVLAGTFFVCGKYVVGGLVNMGNQENIINQYQDNLQP